MEVSKRIEMEDLKRQLRAVEDKNQALEQMQTQMRQSSMIETGTNFEDASNRKNNLVSTLTSPFKFIKDSARNLKNSLGEIWGRLSPSKPQLSSEK